MGSAALPAYRGLLVPPGHLLERQQLLLPQLHVFVALRRAERHRVDELERRREFGTLRGSINVALQVAVATRFTARQAHHFVLVTAADAFVFVVVVVAFLPGRYGNSKWIRYFLEVAANNNGFCDRQFSFRIK